MGHGHKISVTGLGYVGLPVAVAFGRLGRVVGFDIDPQRIAELRSGTDRTREVHADDLGRADIQFTDSAGDLRSADFHIVAVPTPVDRERRPDLEPLLGAAHSVGSALKSGDVVVFESTVFPGATEELCVPLLEQSSGLRCGRDFSVGYSPERINPGDRQHTLAAITKVVSACDPAALEIVARVYGAVVTAGIYRAPSIRVAEAAKVIENTQRDLNIALMNELAMICHRLGIDTADVIRTAATKWNFLPFQPGLVGGHCIGVDPYYLMHKAQALGYSPQVILAGRATNDGMGPYVAKQLIAELRKRGRDPRRACVTVLGFTFKEDIPDTRNTGVAALMQELQSQGCSVQVLDPLVDRVQCRHEHGVEILDPDAAAPADAVVVAVPHAAWRDAGWELVQRLLRPEGGVVYDIRGVLDRAQCPENVELIRL
ncbi:MAG: GDP-mannose dehydrogenase [Gammaproteobacteria bacterium RIFCSPLOWO2_02_FULL_61_13]|nr:MAG: GDP-mannose dehydrogenase [Gammaproteobacteria bacterium RIFCSPLOWO2_02_FULL_61_13]